MMLFEYSKRNTIIHKIPAIIKFLVLIIATISICILDVKISLYTIIICFFISVISKVRLMDFIKDILTVLWYSLFILLVNVISSLINYRVDSISSVFTKDSVVLISRLIAVVTLTSVFFRTTSLFDLFYSLKSVLPVVLFLNFFSRLFSLWETLSKSYYARGGKNGVRKVVRLLPIFIGLSIKKANDTYLSICNRSKTRV